MAEVRFMVMYDDESLDVSLTDGSRLQLSPCGTEYFLEEAPPPHPLQETLRVRRRTRFTLSQHRDLLVETLKFRNKYAEQPYLPEELIPKHLKQNLSSEACEVEWPLADSCRLTCDSGGVVAVSSVEGHARLVLSSCGQEFMVEFTCRTSQHEEREPITQHVTEFTECPAHTRVVQHHSRLHPPHIWTHPLSLALSQWEAQRSHCSDANGPKNGTGKLRELGPAHTSTSQAVVKTRLPLPLPLTCPTPHQHRWRYGSGASDWSDLNMSEVVRVVWCHGIIYRLIGGAVPVVEVSPADGSVIRSNGVLAKYFTHYRPPPSTNVESVYYIKGLPPDWPGQPYSIRNILTRANRILQCYKQSSSSRAPIMPQCCWRRDPGMIQHSFTGAEPLTVSTEFTLPDAQQHLLQVDGAGGYQRSVLAELQKIRKFNYVLDNGPVLNPPTHPPNPPQRSGQKTDRPDLNITEHRVSEALQKTTKTIQDITTLLAQTHPGHNHPTGPNPSRT